MSVTIYFSDYFQVEPRVLEKYGAFNISLVTDLPLFIDPFLLFNSKDPTYQDLHAEMIQYLKFLCEKSQRGDLPSGLIDSWYRFPEIRQTWLGFSQSGNQGHGLGKKFANALDRNFEAMLRDFGDERITKGSHIEKLGLIGSGVGRDMISDFTTNLIVAHLCRYTETFSKKYIGKRLLDDFWIPKVVFNYETESWERKKYRLPQYGDDFVLLTPR